MRRAGAVVCALCRHPACAAVGPAAHRDGGPGPGTVAAGPGVGPMAGAGAGRRAGRERARSARPAGAARPGTGSRDRGPDPLGASTGSDLAGAGPGAPQRRSATGRGSGGRDGPGGRQGVGVEWSDSRRGKGSRHRRQCERFGRSGRGGALGQPAAPHRRAVPHLPAAGIRGRPGRRRGDLRSDSRPGCPGSVASASGPHGLVRADDRVGGPLVGGVTQRDSAPTGCRSGADG